MNSKTKPDGVSDADWDNRKKTIIGLAHYMIGKVYFNQKKYGPADKELRMALPLVEDNVALKPEMLFLIGFCQLQTGESYGGAEVQPAMRRHQEPVPGAGRKERHGDQEPVPRGETMTRARATHVGLPGKSDYQAEIETVLSTRGSAAGAE